jgi:hypothetical protein
MKPKLIAIGFKCLRRPLTIRMKINGDKGSSCLIPLERVKMAKGDPFISIENKVGEVNDNT